MSTGVRSLRIALVAHLGVALLIMVLAYLGRLPIPMPSWGIFDKVMHFALVGGIAFWIVGGWDDPRLRVGPARLPLAVLLPLLVAGAEEALQLLSSRRNADVADFVADALGLVAFWWLGVQVVKRRAAERNKYRAA